MNLSMILNIFTISSYKANYGSDDCFSENFRIIYYQI